MFFKIDMGRVCKSFVIVDGGIPTHGPKKHMVCRRRSLSRNKWGISPFDHSRKRLTNQLLTQNKPLLNSYSRDLRGLPSI